MKVFAVKTAAEANLRQLPRGRAGGPRAGVGGATSPRPPRVVAQRMAGVDLRRCRKGHGDEADGMPVVQGASSFATTQPQLHDLQVPLVILFSMNYFSWISRTPVLLISIIVYLDRKALMADSRWAADERKLSPAYDDISNGRLKSASSQVERHLKKHGGSQPARILRMVLLERVDASESAILEAWEDVKKTGELSSRGMWWVAMTFRNIGRRDLSLQLYQDLWKRSPDSAEIGEQVFLHAAGAWDKPAMVESSRKMFNKLKAPVWARVAAWAEWIRYTDGPSSQDTFTTSNAGDLRVSSTLLSLARRVCDSADSLWLHLQIMIGAGNLSEALKLAQTVGSDGNLARMWYRMEGVKEILRRMGDGEEVRAAWREEWEWAKAKLKDTECQRNYAFYRHLILATKYLDNTALTVAALEAVHADIGAKERAPALALLELGEEVDWQTKVEAYWSQWGAKGSVVSELEGIVGERNETKREALVIMLEKLDSGHTSLAEYRRVVNRELLLLRVRPAEWHTESHFDSLTALYAEGLQYGRNLPKTDIQPCDDVGLALVHLLIVHWSKDTSNDTPLLRATLLTRHILNHSPACKSALLILGRLLRLLGASIHEATVAAAKEWSEIQLDNLAHFSHERAGIESYVNGTTQGWSSYEEKSRKMYRRVSTDMAEYIKQALQHESYSKIPGINYVMSTLGRSMSRCVMSVERSRMALVTGEPLVADTLRDAVNGLGEDLVDTRDWSLVPELGPRRGSLRKAMQLGDEPGPKWIKAWGGLLLRLDVLERSTQVPREMPPNDLSGVLPSERVVMEIGFAWLAKAYSVLSSSEDTGENISLDLAEMTHDGSAWDRLYTFYLLVEVSQESFPADL
ncbi:N-acetyltransferase B complex non catalytic subunit-domain-containing protein [Kockovaella imperatae]|uniref:N-acetyltransferase B complex non catalytic subunit-domain-containing protein n=1 Tax=Kockovaella imperatae TaxID=4999 RepID=A0A1Y1UDI2_9TREE|nr:N-acetyltransferase B complex non catalytic subunit-domain-containing protein [Kockovaella imperatae]ORX35576.1 N-acetyltransferase B complex non catalytic subunit-domain-containing protein [Kockovaella imperatae]